ncbi:DNA damage-inducible protein D [Glaesserella parasuis]|uniref:DNA damage-inducible protein D n=2 Tax=Glaesserella parasuis TaxID=738 RepID=UPI0002E01739|nr:DNA damage-inducible protein D [Glaesserella parasuis]AWY46617.1 DNA damage-inducible protein D [Glaesserella parasuis 29755]KDD81706.1 damage-inducible protein D [Glaesserella parasuis ST4-2]MCT8555636.1 DNA damage-inducible protein D [Glaesserella parasuis]MCT8703602.1 DNA damage-inducible protein D [Glaesserella parasuis]MCT8705738.1 DNA damage-inducible protein D [Glaesserella parasuis]
MNIFEQIKQTENNREFWSARELQPLLGYSKWENFQQTISRAMQSCETAGYSVLEHFPEVRKMFIIGNGAQREQQDYQLSRYACYLIVQNGDPKKEAIAVGQTYFAIQTRRQELTDEAFTQLSEDRQRLLLRQQLREHNSELAEAAQKSGVETPVDYAIFQNHGYKGLYGGMDYNAIHQNKGLKQSQKILDHMGSTELAANLFRATQTADKLKRENIQGKQQANQTHYDVGKKVRQTIAELGGTMPENLPTPEKSIKKLESEQKKREKLALKTGNKK